MRTSLLLLILSFSLLLSFQFLFRLIAWSNYSLMPRRDHSASISLCLILLLIFLLNSSIRAFSLYPLSLAALLNIWTNLFMVQGSCFSYLSSATFVDLLSPFPNSFFNTTNNFSANKDSQSSNSKSAKMFSFYILADPSYIYIRI